MERAENRGGQGSGGRKLHCRIGDLDRVILIVGSERDRGVCHKNRYRIGAQSLHRENAGKPNIAPFCDGGTVEVAADRTVAFLVGGSRSGSAGEPNDPGERKSEDNPFSSMFSFSVPLDLVFRGWDIWRQHSEAGKAWVTLNQQGDRLIVKVGDDGKGVSAEIADMQPGSLGIGLASMRQRAKELGGTMRLSNTIPGTLIEIVIPAKYSLPLQEHATA